MHFFLFQMPEKYKETQLGKQRMYLFFILKENTETLLKS